MNVCDNCPKDCQNLEECLDSHYNDMLRRCNINVPETKETSPEVPQNANNNRPEEELYGEGIGFQRLRRI